MYVSVCLILSAHIRLLHTLFHVLKVSIIIFVLIRVFLSVTSYHLISTVSVSVRHVPNYIIHP